MPRPQRCRRICREPAYEAFLPEGIPAAEPVLLSLDEFEVLRLVDLENFTHQQCARLMEISRTTVTEIYESARHKLAECIVHGRRLQISGGRYRLCDGSAREHCGRDCKRAAALEKPTSQTNRPRLPEAPKGDHSMRIAVTYENGQVFQHFGHTECFLLCDVENGVITQKSLVDTNGSGHGALAGLLAELKADTLICGGIGMGARMALESAGIQLYGGVSGPAEAAVEALISGSLAYNPDVQCDHHGHEHGEGHSCGSHGCGNHGCHE